MNIEKRCRELCKLFCSHGRSETIEWNERLCEQQIYASLIMNELRASK